MYKEQSLSRFGAYIQNLMNGKDLTQTESRNLFGEILQNKQPEIHQGAFLAALSAKGETVDEIAGAWQAIRSFDTQTVDMSQAFPLVENSGTGMDSLKTFNISSAAAIVAASGGARIARHASRALTSQCGAVDILESLGVDMNCSAETVVHSVQSVGIGLFNGMSEKIHPNALFRILKHMRFGSTLNISASLAGPCLPTHGLRGVYSDKIIPKVTHVMQSIGYQKGMVVHGFDSKKEKGMDELSILGESIISEFDNKSQAQTYTICPEDLGLKRSSYQDIAAYGNVKDEAIRFLKVISGKGHEACIDITCLNAGAILYLIADCDNIQKGVEKARQLIDSQKAIQTLVHWVKTQTEDGHDGVKMLLNVSESAGLRKFMDDLF
ncbi:Anthranilate phosphoribosyltransferase [Candidatus Magnetomorum sp. HK-1]|nr:Anthranilate phosphoribosyltransferase [Candidatus Magnetomorum sp. HK-1]